jgi:hypothetical protein
MIKINIDWQGKKGLDNLIRYIENNLVYAEAQEQVRILGHHTADHMRNTINTERKRPEKASHNLDNSIIAETLGTTGGVEIGIGRISTLNAQAPYWEMINDGASYTTRTHHIVPFEDGEFRTFKVGSTHIIEGIDFVGKAIRNLDEELKEMIEKLGEKFINGAQTASH